MVKMWAAWLVHRWSVLGKRLSVHAILHFSGWLTFRHTTHGLLSIACCICRHFKMYLLSVPGSFCFISALDIRPFSRREIIRMSSSAQRNRRNWGRSFGRDFKMKWRRDWDRGFRAMCILKRNSGIWSLECWAWIQRIGRRRTSVWTTRISKVMLTRSSYRRPSWMRSQSLMDSASSRYAMLHVLDC